MGKILPFDLLSAATLAMVSAAILQHYIYNTNECGYVSTGRRTVLLGVFAYLLACFLKYVSTCDGVHSSIKYDYPTINVYKLFSANGTLWIDQRLGTDS